MLYDLKWLTRFMNLAHNVAEWSKDPSTKVGCLIARDKFVFSVGFNGFPRNTSDDESTYLDKEEKYKRILHAELNAVLSAKQDLAGCSAFVTAPCCSQCAAVLVQVGIRAVYMELPSKDFADRWEENIVSAINLFREANVYIHFVKNENGVYSIASCEDIWR